MVILFFHGQITRGMRHCQAVSSCKEVEHMHLSQQNLYHPCFPILACAKGSDNSRYCKVLRRTQQQAAGVL